MNVLKSSGVIQALLVLLLASYMILSCKKGNEDNLIIADASQRLAEILVQRGGINTFMDVCRYDGQRVSSYCRYRWTDDGEWKDWIRYLFEYQGEDKIIEVMEGISDSIWFPAIKWEKQFQDGKIIEIIEAHWSFGETGCWEPSRKLCWNYEGEKLIMRQNYKYENLAWEECWKMNYQYSGLLWTSAVCMENNDGTWDTIKCLYMNYSDGNLREVNIYKHDDYSGWNFDEQYLFEFDGHRISRMIINEAYGDSLSLEMTILIGYDAYGNPISYTEEYECCPTKSTFITYELLDGKDQLPFHNDFAWDQYPWIPSPAMN